MANEHLHAEYWKNKLVRLQSSAPLIFNPILDSLANAKTELHRDHFELIKVGLRGYIEHFHPDQETTDLLSELEEIILKNQIVSINDFSQKYPNRTSFIPYPRAPEARGHVHGGHPLGMYRVENMYLVGAHGIFYAPEGDILKEQNSIVDNIVESMCAAPTDSVDEVPKLQEAVSLSCVYTYCFFHWMLDALPKVLIAESCGFKGVYVVPFHAKWAMETLTAVGINTDRILISRHTLLHAQQLCIPTHFASTEFAMYPSFHGHFREWMLKAFVPDGVIHSAPRKRIYISRKSTGPRGVVNEDALEPIFEEFKIQKVYMEEMSIAQQIQLATQSNVLIGPHGAGMLHALFMEPGSLIIEYFSPTYHNGTTELPARFLKHRYYAHTHTPAFDLPNDGVFIDPEVLSKILLEQVNR